MDLHFHNIGYALIVEENSYSSITSYTIGNRQTHKVTHKPYYLRQALNGTCLKNNFLTHSLSSSIKLKQSTHYSFYRVNILIVKRLN